MKIVVAPETKDDLEEIFDYILQESPHIAALMLKRIGKGIYALRDAPHRGRPGRVAGTRELVISKTPFVVPYQVRGNTIEILRVFHGARRWPDHF
ncbi:MAG: type II toxin-antitoxin system RelE/ParE family toxin [Deltaproteobacteria bacterium]|nr:type II toxin-antitoxin system RelE/ParE family toxin [Deltaproteobacteria bacterium]